MSGAVVGRTCVVPGAEGGRRTGREGRTVRKPQSLSLIVCLAAGLVLSLALALGARAASGDLDATFGTGGKVTTDFAGDDDQANGVVAQSDGKLVAAGVAKTSRSQDFALARYNPNGSLDATFGTGGKVTTDFAGDDDQAFAVALQPDGKIVAVGVAKTSRSRDFALARYNPNGSLDATFGTGGKVTTDFAGNDDTAFAVVLQSDGKIVVAGGAKTSRSQDFALARYNANGSLDATFGTGGKVTTDFAGNDDEAHALVLQPDGKLVAAGQAESGYRGRDFALARYNPNGSLDATFGTGGKVTTDFAGNDDAAFGAVLQSDGKIVAAGGAKTSRSEDFALARYNPNGTLDGTFGTGGKVTTDFNGDDDEAHALVLQPDGKLVAAGAAKLSRSQDFALARYSANGSLDATFGTGGKVTTDFAGNDDAAFALALQQDGKLVAAGGANVGRSRTDYRGSGEDFALARYLG
ncbi:MAG: hypothetical protein E6G02_14550 [Actinobacteria bacterium]|nr:MAG: hypothetical protein E6G02_14550 [Actinomycetota bacterium]